MPRKDKILAFVATQEKLMAASEEIKLDRFEKAEKYLKQALFLQPNLGNAYYFLSKCLQKKQQKTQQKNAYETKAFQLNPCFFHTSQFDYKKVAINIKELYQESRQLINKKSTDEYRWEQLISKFAKKKDLNTTLQILDLFQALKKQNKQYSAQLFSTIGITYYQIGEYKKSLSKYGIAIQIKPNEYRYYNNSAILQYIFKNYQESKRLIQKSLQLNQGYPKSQFILSFSLSKTNQSKLALQKINYSIGKDQKSIMYRLKKLVILATFFPEKDVQITTQLLKILQIIQKKQDRDSYFSNKDNIPILKEICHFILENQRHKAYFKKEWEKIFQLLDQFLIKGHYDKYNITVSMRNLIKKIIQILKDNGIDITNEIQKNSNPLPQQNVINNNNQQQINDLFG